MSMMSPAEASEFARRVVEVHDAIYGNPAVAATLALHERARQQRVAERAKQQKETDRRVAKHVAMH